MSAVRMGLAAIHEVWMLPLEQIEEIEEEIDHELVALKEKIAKHPPRMGMSRWEALNATTVTPSQSPSIEIRKWLEGLPEVKVERSQVSLPQSSVRSIYRKPLPDRPGSDIDPPLVIIKQSIRVVQAWVQDCNEAVVPGQRDSDDESMVSVMGGGIMRRSFLDVPIWKRTRKPVGGDHRNRANSVGNGQTISDCLYDDPRRGLMEEDETAMSGGLAESEARSTTSSIWRRSIKIIVAPVRLTGKKVRQLMQPTTKKSYKAATCHTESSIGESVWDQSSEDGIVTEHADQSTHPRTPEAPRQDLDSMKAKAPLAPVCTNSTLGERCASESSLGTAPKQDRILRHVDSLLLLPIPATKNLNFKRDSTTAVPSSLRMRLEIATEGDTLVVHETPLEPILWERDAALPKYFSPLDKEHSKFAAASRAKTVAPVFLGNAPQLSSPKRVSQSAFPRAACACPGAHYEQSVMQEGTTRRRIRHSPQMPSYKGISEIASSRNIPPKEHPRSPVEPIRSSLHLPLECDKPATVPKAALSSDRGHSENQRNSERTAGRCLRRTSRLHATGGTIVPTTSNASSVAGRKFSPLSPTFVRTSELTSRGLRLTSEKANFTHPVIEARGMTQGKLDQSQGVYGHPPFQWSAVGTLGSHSEESFVMSTVEILSYQQTSLLQLPITTMNISNLSSGSSSGSSFRPQMPKPLRSAYGKEAAAGCRNTPSASHISREFPTNSETDLALAQILGKCTPAPSKYGAEMDFTHNRQRRRVKRSMQAQFLAAGTGGLSPQNSSVSKPNLAGAKQGGFTGKGVGMDQSKHKGRREEQRQLVSVDSRLHTKKARKERQKY